MSTSSGCGAERTEPAQARSGRPWRYRVARVLGIVLVVVVSLATVVLVAPGPRAFVKAPFALAEAFGIDVVRPFAPEVARTQTRVDGVLVDRYDPGSPAPRLLLVPGAARAGRDDERVIGIATSLARAGREVVVPELALYRQEFDPDDLEGVVRVAQQLCAADDGLVLLGFSFGGSLALVAAADDRIADCIDLTATFGAYVDLVGVLQAAATGVSLVGGEEHPWRPDDESTVEEVLEEAAAQLVPAAERSRLRAALDRGDPDGLGPASQVVYRMVTAEDPELVRELVDQLPADSRSLLRTMSPVTVADRVSSPILAAHARDDPAVPYAELLRLEREFPEAETMTVESFRHVDVTFDGGIVPLVRDLVRAWDFMRSVLRPQERWIWE